MYLLIILTQNSYCVAKDFQQNGACFSASCGANYTISPVASGGLTYFFCVLNGCATNSATDCTVCTACNTTTELTVNNTLTNSQACIARQPPRITCPANLTVTPPANVSGAIATFSATATDNSGFVPTVTCSPASGTNFSITAASSPNIVTCTATDRVSLVRDVCVQL